MKKMNMAMTLGMVGLIGIGAYTLMNKKTKAKADELINNVLDKANNMSNKMSK